MSKLTDQQIDVAVQWWKSAISAPKFDTLGETRNDPNADPKGITGMAEMMAMIAHRPVAQTTIDKFGKFLHDRLTIVNSEWFDLAVDYNADQILNGAAQDAGIKVSMTTFPWKTCMRFDDGGVSVKCGYRAPWEELVLKKEATNV